MEVARCSLLSSPTQVKYYSTPVVTYIRGRDMPIHVRSLEEATSLNANLEQLRETHAALEGLDFGRAGHFESSQGPFFMRCWMFNA